MADNYVTALSQVLQPHLTHFGAKAARAGDKLAKARLPLETCSSVGDRVGRRGDCCALLSAAKQHVCVSSCAACRLRMLFPHCGTPPSPSSMGGRGCMQPHQFALVPQNISASANNLHSICRCTKLPCEVAHTRMLAVMRMGSMHVFKA